MLAGKHFDPVLGVDVHISLLPSPAGPIPTPVPVPFVGMVFDPLDYVPWLGATVKVNGLPRANAGTGVFALPPHLPIAGPFLKPPGNEGEIFMGSATVSVDGEPMSSSGVPVLTCQDVGMPGPPRIKQRPRKSLYLPTSVLLPIPSGAAVMVGGPPTISLTALAGHLIVKPLVSRLGTALRKVQRSVRGLDRAMLGASRYLNKHADDVLDKLRLNKEGLARQQVSHLVCTITGHPVDVASGKVFTTFEDLQLQGPLPFKLERIWYSSSTYDGPMGHGWHASFDVALAANEHVVAVRYSDGRALLFPALATGESHFSLRDRMTLQRDAQGYRLIESATGLCHHFAHEPGRADMPRVKLSHRDGRALRFEYEGKLVRIVDSSERVWSLVYAGTRMARIEGPHPTRDERVSYLRCVYDERGNLAEVHDALGGVQRFVYRGPLLVKETNRNGLSFQFEYDGADATARCVRTWGDGGIYDHKLSYDVARGVTTVENSLGFKTQHEHDGAMVHRSIDALGNVRKTEYGVGYVVLSETDELGQQTRYRYDDHANLTCVQRADGSEIKLEYDRDLLVRAVDTLGGEWTCTRDPSGRVVARTDPLGQTTRYEYAGPWLVMIAEAEACTSFAYDERGNLARLVAADGGVTRFEYDRLGRLIESTDACGASERRSLDLLGRVTRLEQPDGNVRELSYDAEGNVLHLKDAHQAVHLRYCGLNRLAARSEAGAEVRFDYDTEEQLTQITNEHGRAYRFVRGPTGALDEEHGFDGLVRKYARDACGRVTRLDRPGQRFAVYSYDALGRLIGVEHHDGAKETYTYRADGALLQADNDDTSVRFERDLLGRVIKETQGELEIENAYDRQGMRVRMRSSLGADVSVTRNSNGDVLSVRAGEFAAQFERDALGRELARSLPGGLRSRWRRDRSGRPVEHIVTAGSGQTLCAVGYGWAPNDRLQRRVDAFKGRDEYHHDARGYLAASRYADDGVDLRVPDAVGNVFKSETRTDREYGPAGQLLRARSPSGDTHYAYDAEGNLIEKRDAAGRAWQYAWNSAGHLASVTRPDGDRVSFTYDPFGRRVSKRYRGQTTKWLWDGDAPLHEWVEQPKSAPTPLTWLFEPESTAPLARLEASTCQALITDHLATPTLVVNSDHSVAWSAGLDAYGNLRDASGDSALCPFRWPGQYADLETGLYYNRHRYYDPESGQYASQDPIRLHGGRALYAYVPDPLTWTDPLGLSCALHERQSAAAEALAPLKQAFPEAAVGFRGSLARGRKGPHKGFAPFDPNNFDVDAFIVSDELAARVPPNRQGFRDLQKAGRQERKLVDDLGRRLSAIPGIRQEKMTVRIFSDDEFARKVRLDERYLL